MNPLELEGSRRGSVGEPDGGGVGENGSDKGFVGSKECFPLLAPVLASKGFGDAESIAGFAGYIVDMRGESKLGVEGDTQDTGDPVERKGEGATWEGDVWVVVVLGGVGGKKGDGRLRGGQE